MLASRQQTCITPTLDHIVLRICVPATISFLIVVTFQALDERNPCDVFNKLVFHRGFHGLIFIRDRIKVYNEDRRL